MPIQYDATIERIVEIAPGTRSFVLRLPEQPRFTFTPGQFISCLLPIDGQTLIRPYSIASTPEDVPLLEICLNRVPNGPGSAYLFSLAVGAPLRFTGPWGTFTLDVLPDAECVFVAEGTGIAPIRAMLRRALTSARAPLLHLNYAAASVTHLLYRDEFESAARADARFVFEAVIGRPLAAHIEERYIRADANRSRHFYICGVGQIVPQLRDLLRHAGYERRAVQYEKW